MERARFRTALLLQLLIIRLRSSYDRKQRFVNIINPGVVNELNKLLIIFLFSNENIVTESFARFSFEFYAKVWSIVRTRVNHLSLPNK